MSTDIHVPRLAAGEIHVWSASLRVRADRLAAYRALLAPDEIARADRIVIPEKREQSIVSRGVLRTLLGAYLHASPASLAFCYGGNGRPSLAVAAEVGFNVSHSGDLAVVAVTARGGPTDGQGDGQGDGLGEGLGDDVGVDVERVRHDVDFLGIGRRFFSEREHADLCSVAPPARPLAFFRCWTRKESYLKARGAGLTLPLSGFDVTLLDARAALLATRFDPADAARRTLHEFVPEPGYVGALCLAGVEGRVRMLRVVG